ncbi:MAG: type II secretion system protein [Kiritimatiellae bacterium]|nr:type II secretion system protein [Kiritimatiellia bacterium]
MRKGFTLLETVFALAIFGLVIGVAMSSWILFMHKSHRVNTQSHLDMDVRRVVERFRSEMRNTARETIIFYPRGVVPYQAVGFALPSDQDGDGLMDMSEGGTNILWRETVVYHVWNQSPYQMRRTVLANRNPDATYAERYDQIASVVTSGNGESAALTGETPATSVLFENLFTGKLWHAEARFDAYAPDPNTRETITFGSVPLAAGENIVKFTIVDKNISSSGRRLRLDQVAASVSGWPIEAENCTAAGVAAAPLFVGQGLASAAYGLESQTSANGDKLSLTLYNDAIEECVFLGGVRNVTFSNTVVRFDAGYCPTGFDSGSMVSKLDGQFGVSNNWTAAQQTTGSRNNYYCPTNCVMRIPVMSDPSINNEGEPISYGIKKDGFGPVFVLYKSLFNGGLKILNPSFSVLTRDELPASGFNSDLKPRLDAALAIPLHFWQGGVMKASWADCDEKKSVELRPAVLIPLFMGNTLMLQFQVSVVNYGTDKFTRYAADRTDLNPVAGANSLPGCWVIPGGDSAHLLLEDWTGAAGLVKENILPTLEFVALNYAETGDYISHVFDTLSDTGSGKQITWQAHIPPGATMVMFARSGDTLSEDGFGISDAPAWENVFPAVNGAAFSGNTGRYVQFRAVFTAQQASQYPGGGGLGVSGPYCSDTPRLRRVLFTWDGEDKYVDITATLLKGPDSGVFKVEVEGQEMVRGVTMEIEIFKDIRGQGGVQERLRSAMIAEVDPRNSGK